MLLLTLDVAGELEVRLVFVRRPGRHGVRRGVVRGRCDRVWERWASRRKKRGLRPGFLVSWRPGYDPGRTRSGPDAISRLIGTPQRRSAFPAVPAHRPAAQARTFSKLAEQRQRVTLLAAVCKTATPCGKRSELVGTADRALPAARSPSRGRPLAFLEARLLASSRRLRDQSIRQHLRASSLCRPDSARVAVAARELSVLLLASFFAGSVAIERLRSDNWRAT